LNVEDMYADLKNIDINVSKILTIWNRFLNMLQRFIISLVTRFVH